MTEKNDFLDFKKGAFKPKSLEDLLGKTEVKEHKNEYERIEECLNHRRKMAELCDSLARRLRKHAEARDLPAIEGQVRHLNEMLETLRRMDVNDLL